MAKNHESKKITPMEEDFSKWYLDIVEVAELAENSPVRGSMIIKPHGYAIWENIRKELDFLFKSTDVENAYFPLFIPEKFLKKEKEHVEGFSPELAVVTHAGGKKLEEPLIVRPTSETIIHDSFSRWIESHRDLPLLINQWANVVRWELRPRVFLRTTEFLWQEGHTAHATEEEAEERTLLMLETYKYFVEEYMAIPLFTGLKTENEKFAGAVRTYAIEALMQDGKALQMGTSHNLGQNFSKPFDIKYMDVNNREQYCWLTSWGLSTRTIGGLIMAHSDNKGLVLPPRISPLHAVIIPIWPSEEDKEEILKKSYRLASNISEFKVKVDSKDSRTGEKHFEWEKKGIPLRIEYGPRDIKNRSVMVIRRDTGEKEKVKIGKLNKYIEKTLEDIQKSLFEKALKYQKEKTKTVDTWDEFKKEIEAGNAVWAFWNGDSTVENQIKAETKATIRVIPLEQKEENGKCIYSQKEAKNKVLFAKSY